jgi:hypothetical protein
LQGGDDQSLSNSGIKAARIYRHPAGDFGEEKGIAKLLLNG